MFRVVSTSPLPIDLGAQLPGARVEVAETWAGLSGLDLGDADALVCLLLDRVDAAVLARAPRLRVIANCAVGYDNVDLAAATAAGIAVTNTPDVLTEATAEFTWALILAVARRLPEAAELVRAGTWPGWRLDQLLGIELAGKTLGIVGMGRIGRAVARRADAFGMRVIAAGRGGGVDELCATADVISLHCPLTPETLHLIDAARLARMKPSAIVINTARGGCVDEAALIDALARRRIFGAGLDVFEGEPAVDPRLRADPRLVLAPHLGSATTETRTAMAQLCADAVIAVRSGRRPVHLVNRELVLHA
ncbi:MAG TPA: D-glycerate dehydrogenase [Kofleriaceae bacterium]